MKPTIFGSIGCVLALSCIPPDAAADTIFKCIEKNGVLRYQSTRCEQLEELDKWNVKTAAPSVQNTQQNVSYVSVRKGAGGAYRVDGEINGAAVSMTVDAAVPYLSIPSKMAEQLKLEKGDSRELTTANGQVAGYDTVVRMLKIGNLIINNMPAVISPDSGGILLGQSVLGVLKVEQSKDELRLSAP